MLKKAAILIFAFLLIGSLARCAFSEDINITLAKDESIELSKGRTITIELKANPTTGYKWQVLEKSNEGVLMQEGEGEYIPSDTNIPRRRGSGGVQIYRFKALKQGEATLVFEYKRPWEEKEPARKYTVQIKVN